MRNLTPSAVASKRLSVASCDRCRRPIAVGTAEQVARQLQSRKLPAWLRERPGHKQVCHACRMCAIDALLARSRMAREGIEAALRDPQVRVSEVSLG